MRRLSKQTELMPFNPKQTDSYYKSLPAYKNWLKQQPKKKRSSGKPTKAESETLAHKVIRAMTLDEYVDLYRSSKRIK